MMGPHMLVVGTIEAVVTSMIYIFLTKTNAELLENYSGLKLAAAGSFRLKPLIIGLVLLLVCTPLGLLATGTAWGEWGSEEVGEEIGYVPGGMERFFGLWGGFLPDYAFPENEEAAAIENDAASGAENETVAGAEDIATEAEGPVSLDGVGESAPAYLISGVLGLLLVGGLALVAVKLLTRSSRKKEQLG